MACLENAGLEKSHLLQYPTLPLLFSHESLGYSTSFLCSGAVSLKSYSLSSSVIWPRLINLPRLQRQYGNA